MWLQNRNSCPAHLELLGDTRQDIPGVHVRDANTDDAAMKVDWERVPWSHPTASVLVVAPRLERLELELGRVPPLRVRGRPERPEGRRRPSSDPCSPGTASG